MVRIDVTAFGNRIVLSYCKARNCQPPIEFQRIELKEFRTILNNACHLEVYLRLIGLSHSGIACSKGMYWNEVNS